MIGYKVKDINQLPAAAEIPCPHCHKPILLHTHARAALVACGSCFKMFDTRGNSLTVHGKFSPAHKSNPVIPIGTKGGLKEVVYAVVGFAKYKELNQAYYWREYVLFNPVHGYALLSEYDGHWTYFRFISDYSHRKAHVTSFNYQGHAFNLFNKYQADVLFAQGEFFWDIYDDNCTYTEYIAPPLMVTRLVGNRELSWLLGEYLEPDVVKKALGIEQGMPLQSGVGAAEPFSTNFSFAAVKNAVLIALALLLIFQIFFSKTSQEKILNEGNYTLPASTITNTLPPQPGPVITLANTWSGKTNLEFILYAPVTNNWLSVGVTLANTKTHREYNFEMGVEYYAGYTDGESWSEGDRQAEKIISAIPMGTYQVILQPYRENYSSIDSFDLTIVQDVPIWSNFWVILGLIFLFPGIQWLREYSFEKRRWMSSDYSPYD
ncbi:MAG: DUF4178 domain-containing protein [Adhaeribacter sp.]